MISEINTRRLLKESTESLGALAELEDQLKPGLLAVQVHWVPSCDDG